MAQTERRFPGVYHISDGTIEANIGGIDAVDALEWYAMPTESERQKITYDAEADVAHFYNMVAAPAVPKVTRARQR